MKTKGKVDFFGNVFARHCENSIRSLYRNRLHPAKHSHARLHDWSRQTRRFPGGDRVLPPSEWARPLSNRLIQRSIDAYRSTMSLAKHWNGDRQPGIYSARVEVANVGVLKPISGGESSHRELNFEPTVSRDSASAFQSWRQSHAEARDVPLFSTGQDRVVETQMRGSKIHHS